MLLQFYIPVWRCVRIFAKVPYAKCYLCDRLIYREMDKCTVIKSALLIIYCGSLIRAVRSAPALCITLNHPARRLFDRTPHARCGCVSQSASCAAEWFATSEIGERTV